MNIELELAPKINKLPDLASIELKVPKLANSKEPKIRESYTRGVVFKGVTLTMDILNISSIKNFDTLIEIGVFKGEKNVAGISINLSLAENESTMYVADTDVRNTDRELKELGRTLWEMSLKLIQKTADEWNISITHKVHRSPDWDLGKNKWDKLFVPLLSKYEYTNTEEKEDFWEKIYKPNKK